ncbi:hypothetical protein [Neisseria sp. RH3002v2f]|uniref:hypothetical protein n=1 Tax=Neisseria sp. RH3002v2f TaxID=1871108 RepID=UPI001661690A|nr:hypothetical protein [Neisseria sp. RH3002v2f]
MQPCRLQGKRRHADARFCEMRESAQRRRTGEALPTNKSVRDRRVSDGIGSKNKKAAANIWRSAL